MWKKLQITKITQNCIVTQYMYVNAEYLVMTSHSSIFEFCSTFGSWNVTTFLNDSTEVCCSRDSNTQLPACGVNALSHHTLGNEYDYVFFRECWITNINQYVQLCLMIRIIHNYVHIFRFALLFKIRRGLNYFSEFNKHYISNTAESCLLSRINRFLI